MIKSIKTIYKAAIALHFTTTKWKASRVVYIPKVGRDDYSIAKLNRPFSLMSYLLKMLERLSVWTTDTAIDENPLHIKQHGFKKGERYRNSHIKYCTQNFKMYIKWGTLHGSIDRHTGCLWLHNTWAYQKCPDYAWMPEWHSVDWYYEPLTYRNLQTTYENFVLEATTNMGFPQHSKKQQKYGIQMGYLERYLLMTET